MEEEEEEGNIKDGGGRGDDKVHVASVVNLGQGTEEKKRKGSEDEYTERGDNTIDNSLKKEKKNI